MNAAVNTAVEPAPLLEVSGIAKSFAKPDGQELLVLEGVNLSLAAGQIVGLLGRSGSGKSTLLRLIAGLAEPSRGELQVHALQHQQLVVVRLGEGFADFADLQQCGFVHAWVSVSA